MTVLPQRLKKYFTEENGRYVLGKRLRDRILFARQDLLSDPPFSKLDLIICRNVMIYLDAPGSEPHPADVHFALKQDGILFLGSSETVGKQAQLFATLSKEWRIYRSVGEKQSDRVILPHTPPDGQAGSSGSQSRTPARMQSYRQSVHRRRQERDDLALRFRPASW